MLDSKALLAEAAGWAQTLIGTDARNAQTILLKSCVKERSARVGLTFVTIIVTLLH